MVLSTATYAMQLATSLALVIIVSRLLLPAEIGAYLIASAVMILVLPLRDFQVQSYVLQRVTIDFANLRPVALVAWMSAGASILMVLAAAGIFSVAYPDAPISVCLLIMGLSLAIRPFALLPMSLLARDLRYGSIAIIQLSGAVLKLIVTLGLIANGGGAEALAWGYVVELAFETTAVFLVAKEFRLVRPAFAGSGEVVRFAAPFAGANFVLTVSMAAIPIIIGGTLGLAASAFFNRARTVSQFFRSSVEGAVHQIVLQRFAALRENLEALESEYTKSIVLLTAISWPGLVWLVLSAEPLTLLLFGPQWIETAPMMQGLAVAGMIYSATAFSRQLHAGMGDTSLLLRRDGWLQIPLLVAVTVAAQSSSLAVVVAIALVSLVALIVHTWVLVRRLETNPRALAWPLVPSLLVALLVFAATMTCFALLDTTASDQTKVLATLVPAAGAWAIGLILFRHPLLGEILGFLSTARIGTASGRAD